MRYQFSPNYKVVAKVDGVASIQALSDEVGVYAASPEFARKHCGPIVLNLLKCVPEWYYEKARVLGLYPNIDARIHRLYPGNYPAYPGWHCDGEYRETYFSQPDMDKVPVHSHLTATISSHEDGVSNTEFLMDPFDCEVGGVDSENKFWGQIDKAVNTHERDVQMIPDGNLTCFDSWTLHRCTPARIRGWRLFFRMSMWHRPYLGDEGKLSRQEQVYLLREGDGW